MQKPLYPEGEGICHSVILHPPGALATGDTLHLDVRVRRGAHAVLSTPAATKWYKSCPPGPGDPPDAPRFAGQFSTLHLEPGSRLEWLPQENIYFDRSHSRQDFTLVAEAGARAIGWDIHLLGRRASGERWRHARLQTRQRLLTAHGQPLWHEQQRLHSDSPSLQSPQGLAGYPVFGTLWALAAECQPALAHALASDLPFDDEIRAGATALPDGVLLVRAVAQECEAIRDLFYRLWLSLRRVVMGVEGQPLRLWST